MILKGYIYSLLYGIVCLLLAMLAYKLGMPKKYTRKIVHILVGFEWVILYAHFGTSIHFLVVCLVFTALLALTYKGSLFPMISSDSDNAPGTVYYCVSMSVMAFVCFFYPDFIYPFGIAVMCTSLADGFAGVIGALITGFNPRIYGNKTLFGTLACFAVAFVSALVMSSVLELGLSLDLILALAFFVAGIELICSHGLDNIAVPLGTFVFSYLAIFGNIYEYVVPLVLTPYVIALVLAKGILSPRGVGAAVILDVIVSLAFGNFGFVLLLSFLALTAVIDKIKHHFRKHSDEISRRGERRDELQVFANGAAALICALIFLITHSSVFIVAYTAALAECFADSCASGVGSLSRSAFDIFKMKKVPVGLSGGMSVLGTAASFVGAALLPLITVAFGLLDLTHYILVLLCAFAGALVDSFLGSLLQAKYKCGVCGIVTEKLEHCGERCSLLSGASFVNNDTVNVISSAFSALLVYLIII